MNPYHPDKMERLADFMAVDITPEVTEPWHVTGLHYAIYRLCPCNLRYSILGFVRQLEKLPDVWAAYRSEVCAEVLIGRFTGNNARQEAFDCIMAA